MIAFSRCVFRAGLAVGLLAAVSLPFASLASAASNPDQLHANIEYGKSPKGVPLRADIYTPTGEDGHAPVVIIVHGGGFNSGDKQGESQYSASMASNGFVAVNVNYTLSTPSASGYPQQVHEIQNAISWTIAHASEYGGDPHRIALVGFSAGGYLAAMASLLDSDLPGRPIKAVVTLSAPLDLPALDQLLRERVAACGYQTSCPQMPQAPQLSAFGTLFDFLGCPTGNCSSELIQGASPSSHVTGGAPAFLMFNSSDELIPRSQATDMGDALRSARVPEQVVIVPGSQHGETYLPDVDGNILTFLDGQLGVSQQGQTPISAPTGSSGTPTVLVVCCAVVAAGGLGVVMLAMRRRAAVRR